ncbi:MAG TPA: hypothetical protein PK993_03665 [Clostridia bacterium]|nr:hypothetical protein [Clostridia bacterium]
MNRNDICEIQERQMKKMKKKEPKVNKRKQLKSSIIIRKKTIKNYIINYK